MQTKHTSGKWDANNNNNNEYIDIDCDGIRICTISLCDEVISKEEAIYNGKLISAAPYMLKTLMDCYLLLQIQSSKDVSFAIKTDSVRANIRNSISHAIGVDAEDVQFHFENNAFKNR